MGDLDVATEERENESSRPGRHTHGPLFDMFILLHTLYYIVTSSCIINNIFVIIIIIIYIFCSGK